MTEDGRPVKSFEDLDVFRRAYRVSLEVHRASLEFPRIEQSALADQLRRASKSIRANIAEGFGRQKLPRGSAGRSGRNRSFGGFCGWRWVRVTRCGYGCAMLSISAILVKRFGSVGGTRTTGSRACCRVSRAVRESRPIRDPSSVFCSPNAVAERSVGL